MQGSFAPQFTRPNALDDPMVQVARVVAVSVVSPSRGESFVGCCGYMVRANAPIEQRDPQSSGSHWLCHCGSQL